tara:strand:- start:69067 stop:69501 length:435 start_codon:yes stop_codon:yes gene_type:complete
MKILTVIRHLLFSVMLAAFAGHAAAHTALTASVPANGSTVSSAEKLTLNFGGPVRLLRLTLVHGASHQMDIGFEAVATQQTEFSYELPALMNGAHTVNWTIIGADGHTISESFGFTVDPAASAAHADAAASHAHHTQTPQAHDH